MNKLFLAVAMVAMTCGRASAVLVVDDSFDTYENQAQFTDVWKRIGTGSPDTSIGSPNSAILDIGFGVEEGLPPGTIPNSVRVPGTSDNDLYQNQLTFDPTPLLNVGDELIWSFDYWDNAPDLRPFDNYATLQTVVAPDGSQAGQVISLGLGSNQFQDESGGNFYMASISGHSHSNPDPDGGPVESDAGTQPGAFFKLNDPGAGPRGGDADWYNLKLVISTSDGNSVDHAYFVDGVLSETVSNAGPVLQYGVIRLGSGLANGGRMVRFDNMQLEFVQGAAVPEASALAAMGLVGLLSAGAVWVRKRRARRNAA